MNKSGEFPTSQTDEGLAAACDANHEFDVWQRVKEAARITEDSCPEGISPEDAYERFEKVSSAAGELIGPRSGAVMTEEGLQFPKPENT